MIETQESNLESVEPVGKELSQEVGQQVRAIRSRRGMTRKQLAHHSDVSERYLAQLEGGSANISISLLSRIARALGVNFPTLLPMEEELAFKFSPLRDFISSLSAEQQEQAYFSLVEQFGRERKHKHGVALLGLRGAGKSTLGLLLAEHFQIPFVGLDKVITESSSLGMGDLISLRGQDVYRRYEREALEKTTGEYDHVVLETGGSLISEKETYRLLMEHYFIVWIRANPEDHMQRVIDQGDLRPLEGTGRKQAMQDMIVILDEREADYKLADSIIMTSGRSIEDCLKELIIACEPVLSKKGDDKEKIVDS